MAYFFTFLTHKSSALIRLYVFPFFDFNPPPTPPLVPWIPPSSSQCPPSRIGSPSVNIPPISPAEILVEYFVFFFPPFTQLLGLCRPFQFFFVFSCPPPFNYPTRPSQFLLVSILALQRVFFFPSSGIIFSFIPLGPFLQKRSFYPPPMVPFGLFPPSLINFLPSMGGISP